MQGQERDFEDVEVVSWTPAKPAFDPNHVHMREQMLMDFHFARPVAQSCAAKNGTPYFACLWEDHLFDLRLGQTTELHKVTKSCLAKDFLSYKPMVSDLESGINKLDITLFKTAPNSGEESPKSEFLVQVDYFHVEKPGILVFSLSEYLSTPVSRSAAVTFNSFFQGRDSVRICWKYTNCPSWNSPGLPPPRLSGEVEDWDYEREYSRLPHFELCVNSSSVVFSRDSDLALSILSMCLYLYNQKAGIGSLITKRVKHHNEINTYDEFQSFRRLIIYSRHQNRTLEHVPKKFKQTVGDLGKDMLHFLADEKSAVVMYFEVFGDLNDKQIGDLIDKGFSKKMIVDLYWVKCFTTTPPELGDYFEYQPTLSNFFEQIIAFMPGKKESCSVNVTMRSVWPIIRQKTYLPSFKLLENALVEMVGNKIWLKDLSAPVREEKDDKDDRMFELEDPVYKHSFILCDTDSIIWLQTKYNLGEKQVSWDKLHKLDSSWKQDSPLKSVKLAPISKRHRRVTCFSDSTLSCIYAPYNQTLDLRQGRSWYPDHSSPKVIGDKWYLRVEKIDFDQPEALGFQEYMVPMYADDYIEPKFYMKCFENNRFFALAILEFNFNLTLAVFAANQTKNSLDKIHHTFFLFDIYDEDNTAESGFWKKDDRFFYLQHCGRGTLRIYCSGINGFQPVCRSESQPVYKLRPGHRLVLDSLYSDRLTLFTYRTVKRGITTPNQVRLYRIILDI